MANNYDEDEDDYEEKPKFGPPKQNRASAQEDVDDVVKDLHLEPDERKELHDLLKQDYLGYQEILERAKAYFPKRHVEYQNEEKDRW